jgi:histidine triad (HIT) family protein
MSSCPFCKIINGEAPSQKIDKDARVFAFKDIRPQAPVHVLVCPRVHIPTMNDVASCCISAMSPSRIQEAY